MFLEFEVLGFLGFGEFLCFFVEVGFGTFCVLGLRVLGRCLRCFKFGSCRLLRFSLWTVCVGDCQVIFAVIKGLRVLRKCTAIDVEKSAQGAECQNSSNYKCCLITYL